MVQRNHPCIALPCTCIIATGIGLAISLVLVPFTSEAVPIGVSLILSGSGFWFSILAGVWYKRSRNNILWVLIAVVSGWFVLSAGLFAILPIATAMGSSVVGTIIGFSIATAFLAIDDDILLPLPHIARTISDRGPVDSYSYSARRVQYQYREQVRTPRYWGSWKGKVVRAIAEARTPLTLEEIIPRTDISPSAVATAILELLEVGALRYENDETHTVEPGLYHEYRSFLDRSQTKKVEFTPPTPMIQTSDGRKHRTNNGEMVRSKSEVIVANILARLGLYYEYEKPLENPHDPSDFLKPDFTIHHSGKVFYWEHLGMLQKPQYKASWEWKMNWYRKCGYEVITSRDGEDGSIDAQTIEAIARSRILQSV